MSQAAYARHRRDEGLRGGSPSGVHRAIRVGIIPRRLLTKDRKIKSAKLADEAWAAATKAEMAPLTGPTAPAANDDAAPPSELASARARRETAVARLAEIELAEKESTLVAAKDVEARVADLFLRCRTRLLGLPAQLREQDPTFTEAQLQLVERVLYSDLEELAGGDVLGTGQP